jgi:predicted signal transduction protein with EAL and GGDEF domain
VSDLLHDPDAKAIVKSSISLAQEIGIPTVAEGIENRETLSWLISNGCTRGQGYLLCPPGDFDKSILLAQSSTNHKYEIGEFDSGDVSSSTGTVSTKECQTTATLTVTPDIT